MQNRWKPTVAGVLAITGGALILLFASIISISLAFAASFRSAVAVTILFGGLYFAAGIVALIGGISALQRRRWSLALAGSICAILPPATMLGIASIVFIAIAREDFTIVRPRGLAATAEKPDTLAETSTNTPDASSTDCEEQDA